MLEDCDHASEEALLAVAWGEQSVLEMVLERQRGVGHEVQSIALEAALMRSDSEVTTFLI